MDYETILEDVHSDVEDWVGKGKVADYIPALARVPIDKFGMALRTVEGETASIGDAAERFSIQSISKVFTLTLAMKLVADKVWEQVGREPSGSPFNSLVQLEQERGMPRNPFINAGAIAITDFIVSHTYDARQAILDFVRSLCGSREAGFDTEVAQSEKETGFRNAALANFLKSFGRIENNVEQVLDTYFHQCSLAMSCAELAAACGYLAHEGVSPVTGETIVSGAQAKRINALMLTCGTYDAAGEFAFAVGLPAKSGVGGGILAIVPKRLSLCVWSPGLGPSGNSLAGMKALECFTTRTGLSIF